MKNRSRDQRIEQMYTLRTSIIRRSADVIEDTFNLMLLALLLYFTTLFCLQGFLIISVSHNKGKDVYSFGE